MNIETTYNLYTAITSDLAKIPVYNDKNVILLTNITPEEINAVIDSVIDNILDNEDLDSDEEEELDYIANTLQERNYYLNFNK